MQKKKKKSKLGGPPCDFALYPPSPPSEDQKLLPTLKFDPWTRMSSTTPDIFYFVRN